MKIEWEKDGTGANASLDELDVYIMIRRHQKRFHKCRPYYTWWSGSGWSERLQCWISVVNQPNLKAAKLSFEEQVKALLEKGKHSYTK